MSAQFTFTNGKLDKYAWPGGYPLYYLDKENSVLCPACAQKSLKDEIPQFRPVAVAVNYESDDLYCDQCSTGIESAYGNTADVS